MADSVADMGKGGWYISYLPSHFCVADSMADMSMVADISPTSLVIFVWLPVWLTYNTY